MYNIQLGKSVISFCCLVATNGMQDFLHTLSEGGFMLVILGLTGAVGQVRSPRLELPALLRDSIL